MDRLTAAIRIAALAAATLLGTSTARAQEPINPVCPVMEEPIDPAYSVEHEGALIGLCCDGCVERFAANPDKYLVDMPEWQAFVATRELASAPPEVVQTAESAEGFGTQLGRLHPLLVHFPIALVLFAAFTEVLVLMGFASAGAGTRLALWVGTLGGGLATLTGLRREDAMSFGEAAHEIAEQHETMAFVTLGACAVALVFLEVGRRKEAAWPTTAYRVVLLLAAGAVAYTGHLGGSLVFGSDYLPFF